MKYLALIFFAVALAWTWNIVHKDPQVSFETHSGIQEKLAVLIIDTIKSKKPTATDIVVENVWTEFVGENKVKAHFLYSFKEPSEAGMITSQIKGETTLERQPDDGSGLDRWQLGKVQTTSDVVVFDDGLLVTPGAEEGTNPPSIFSEAQAAESSKQKTGEKPEKKPEKKPEQKPTQDSNQ
jgi:hypothetical protein